MYVAEQLSLDRGQEERTGVELPHPAHVVEEGRREQKVGTKAWMQLRYVTAEGGDADGVFEQTARPSVMTVRRRRQLPQPRSKLPVGGEPGDKPMEIGMCDLVREEVEEAVELLDDAPRLRDERSRFYLGSLESAHLELETVAETLDPAEHPNGVTLAEASVEKLDVAPDTCVDSAARIDELEGEVGAAAACSEAPFPGHGKDPFDDPVLGKLCDPGRRHECQSRPPNGW